MSQKGKRDKDRGTQHEKSLCANQGPDCAPLSALAAAKAALMWGCPARSQELHRTATISSNH